ncbi:GNAT family N-acetyltransferase [Paenibacillus sp. GbtcB18]|uniref:GNAT family N-acetyltransferase n=1 Tax=Paenibacillus sp. GbtcB18 TaxID=2824763 RepID=UPI001C2F163E|nr:GNAT family N-acetyltransferase [Paenibacillus sp. GbtcB18]
MSELNRNLPEEKNSAPSETGEEGYVDIVVQKQGTSYILTGIGGTVGEMTYHMVDVDTWIVNHTFIEPKYRGRNLGRMLLDYVVAEARENGRKIIPACSYVLEQFKQNPDEFADVWLKEGETQYSDTYSSDSVMKG